MDCPPSELEGLCFLLGSPKMNACAADFCLTGFGDGAVLLAPDSSVVADTDVIAFGFAFDLGAKGASSSEREDRLVARGLRRGGALR